ncbi:hypothetical protein D3C75_625120 [compost metagenome]
MEVGYLLGELQVEPEVAADGGLVIGPRAHLGLHLGGGRLQSGYGLLGGAAVTALEHEGELDDHRLGGLLAGAQPGVALHQEVALAIAPVGVGQHLQGAEGVAHRGLDGLEQGAVEAGLLDGGCQQGAQADYLGEQAGVALGQPGALQDIGGEVGVIETPGLLQAVVHLQSPVGVGPLGVDAAKQQGQHGSQDDVAAAPERRLYVSRHPADYDPQGDADEQPHIGALAERQVAAQEHDGAAPDQHQWQGVELQIEGHHTAGGAEDGADHPLQRPGEHVAPERDGAHHHHQRDEGPGALRQLELPGQQEGEGEGQGDAQAVNQAVATIDQQIEAGERRVQAQGSRLMSG